MKSVLDLCEYFEVVQPSIFHARGRSACYCPTAKQIRISAKYVATKWVFVHELAHHVDYQVNRDRRGRRSHDVEFFKVLCTLVELAYDDMSDYPWYAEYRMIYKWAVMKGYVKAGLNHRGEVTKDSTYLVKFMDDDDMHSVTIEAATADSAAKKAFARYGSTIISAKRIGQ